MKIDIHNNKIIMLGILCVFCCLSVVVMIFTFITVKGKGVFTPPEFDRAAIAGMPDVPANLGFSPLEVEQGYTAYVCGKLFADGRNVDLYFTSPETNLVWLMLRITDETGTILGETGIIRPGEYVKTLILEKTPKKEINVKLKIIAYRPETYSSMGTVGLNTKLKITDRGN